MSDFKREARYYVIKQKNLTEDQDTALCDLLSTYQVACTDCVVVEKDWLNYEHTWKTIQDVVSGKFCDPYEEIDRLQARVAELKASAVVPVAHIKWSNHKQSNDEIQYDHVIGETPFGQFQITWKGWKEDSCPTVDDTPWGGFLNAYSNVEEAKKACQTEYQNRIEKLLQ